MSYTKSKYSKVYLDSNLEHIKHCEVIFGQYIDIFFLRDYGWSRAYFGSVAPLYERYIAAPSVINHLRARSCGKAEKSDSEENDLAEFF